MDCGGCRSAGPVPATFPGAVLKRVASFFLPLILSFSLRGADSRPPAAIEHSAELDALLSRIASEVVAEFASRGLTSEGADFVIVAFTKGVKTVPDVIPRIYEKVGARFSAAGAPSW